MFSNLFPILFKQSKVSRKNNFFFCLGNYVQIKHNFVLAKVNTKTLYGWILHKKLFTFPVGVSISPGNVTIHSLFVKAEDPRNHNLISFHLETRYWAELYKNSFKKIVFVSTCINVYKYPVLGSFQGYM